MRLSFAGDVHFADKVRKQAGSSGLRTLPGLIGDSDIAMANLSKPRSPRMVGGRRRNSVSAPLLAY